ncbi:MULTISPECIES: DUF2199 domain-containing protein [Streptomyces]|uniref:DUF2199 domain-containing protein n=2 Tax=Streptomyces TaxID=1883 RepID=A0ABU4KDQ3_9ACTN|nr:DUF2199 domain-containing protein [Streptomyces roseolus]MDX2295908.1 DUF2199 domain-containing protein [Streptomyces roseolus]
MSDNPAHPSTAPSTAPATCSCCGDALVDERRIDVRFGLPDVAFELPEEARRSPGPSALLALDGGGFFVRCLLPVRLTGETELVLGAWVEVDETTFRRAADVWDDAAGYAELVVRGRLANAVRPWGEEVLGAEFTGRIRDVEELPYLVEGHGPAAVRLLGDVWDRDHVLARFPHPLPVAVRTDLGDGWSVERTAGFSARFENGADQFGAPDRSVAVGLFQDTEPGRSAEDFLAALLRGGPEVPAGQDHTERLPDGGVRYAFWCTPEDTGRPRHELTAYAVEPDGSAAGLYCSYEEPERHAWARHVWRSLRRDA